ncbi:hypothetical protein Plhal710r2_c024g0096961 [Plasmopara halstedii]
MRAALHLTRVATLGIVVCTACSFDRDSSIATASSWESWSFVVRRPHSKEHNLRRQLSLSRRLAVQLDIVISPSRCRWCSFKMQTSHLPGIQVLRCNKTVM